MYKKRINIYGGGAAGLILASQLLKSSNFDIKLFEKSKRVGSKLLVAGKGGFNLSNDQKKHDLSSKYTPPYFLQASIEEFGSEELRTWFHGIGIQTYIGSSKRIFPIKGIKPIEVLNAIMDNMTNECMQLHFDHEVVAWTEEGITTKYREIKEIQKADIHIFCFGGASWSVTGSDGSWEQIFNNRGVKVNKFGPANCGLETDWNQEFLQKYAGTPLKNIAIQHNSREYQGEALITNYGIEGNAIYPISGLIAEEIDLKGSSKFTIDFKPGLSEKRLSDRLRLGKGNTSEVLRELNLPPVSVALLKQSFDKKEWVGRIGLCRKIKGLDVVVRRPRPIDEAISTSGGVDLTELSENFELLRFPTYFTIGEMCDWNTITGGYLLQGCFSMAMSLSSYLSKNQELELP